mgnify:FL=1
MFEWVLVVYLTIAMQGIDTYYAEFMFAQEDELSCILAQEETAIGGFYMAGVVVEMRTECLTKQTIYN